MKVVKRFENFLTIYRITGTNKELDREFARIVESYPVDVYRTREQSRICGDDGSMISTVTHFNDDVCGGSE